MEKLSGCVTSISKLEGSIDVMFLLDVSGKVLLISFPLEAEKSTDGRKSVFDILKSFS